MDQTGLIGIAKLNGENWTTWKFQVEITLKSKRYFEIVSGAVQRPATTTEEWDSKDAKAQEIIVSRLEEKVVTHILSCKTAAEMWTKLKAIYEHQSQVSVHVLTQRFFSLEYTEGKAAEFMSQLEEIKGTLKSLGEEISDKMIITKVLMSLPENMKHFISAWESTPTDKQTLTDLMSRLMLEEERGKNVERHTALASTTKFVKSRKDIKCFECNKIGHMKKDCRRTSKKECHFCKKPGHLMQDCWFKKRKEEEEKRDNRKAGDQALVSESILLNCSDDVLDKVKLKPDYWWMDSGATEHMCFDKEQFRLMEKLPEKRQVRVGNGTLVDVQGIGTVQVTAWNGSEWVSTDLNNVLYVPDLSVNLFSLSTTLDKNYEMHSNKNKCELIDIKGKVRAIAERQGNLYKMQFKIKKFTQNIDMQPLQCNAVISIHDWHRKLAHINFDQVKKVLKRNNIQFTDDPKPFCEICLAGKQRRLPFSVSESRAENTCELIHSDLCGPIEAESLGGAKYFLLLKDDYSGYRYVYFLKNKSEVERNIENFIAMAENVTGNKIKILRTDNGLEFVNEKILKICNKKGIVHQKTCIYTPEQNGRAERENRTIVESVRTLLQSSGLSKSFWAEAANTAIFSINRAGKSPQKDQTPFQAWYKKNCNVEVFKEFGSKVSVHIPKQKRRKLDAKNEIGIFVGYSEEVKGYRVYFPNKNKVQIHRDVVFIPEIEEKGTHIRDDNKIVLLDSENEDEDVTENDDHNVILDPEIEILRNSEEPEEDTSSEEEISGEVTVRSGKREIKKPAWMQDYDMSEADMCFYSNEEEPVTLEEAVSGKNSVQWKKAMEKELTVLRENNTWSEVPWPVNKKVIESKWVFKIKNENDFKARLVARGFQQESSDDLYDIYAPVAKLTTFRILLVVAIKLCKPIHQMDVRSAFLYGDINEEVFMTLPSKNRENSKTVCKLNKSIYGLKKSPKCWNTTFDNLMKSEGYVRSENDHCLYSKCTNDSRLYILIYVDDLLILGTNRQEVNNLKVLLSNNFCMKDLGIISQYLGITVRQNLDEGYTELSQENYLKKILQKFGMQDCKPINTPIDVNTDFNFKNTENDPDLQKLCRQIIGSLMYAVQGCRPDLCECVSLLSRYQDKANNNLFKALKRVLRYVKGSLDLKLIFKPDNMNNLCGFVDSDWGGDIYDRKSTSGYVFKLLNCTILWASRKQQCVSISSTESEYIALSLAVSEACWLVKVLKDFCLFDLDEPIIMYEDNQSAIKVATNPENNKRLKHVDVRFYFIKEKIDNGLVNIVHIKSEDQLADMFTKPLARIKFEKFRKDLGLLPK